jgi:5'-nucleotidase
MSKSSLPHILVCNDDGITAPGIRALVEAVRPFGTITVVAPDSPQSGMGHAISVGKPLRLNKFDFGMDVAAYACSGTPADCVKLATGILKLKPTLLVSGINHGSNSSISIFYSGTMSAAMEGVIEGIPSIGFSLCDYALEADFTASKTVVATLVQAALHHRIPEATVLNVNIPKVSPDGLKGIRITRQARGRYEEEFDHRTDPYGRDYYWLTGKYVTDDHGEDTDEWALRHGYVSVCPAMIDITASYATPLLNQWEMKLGDGVAS